MENNNKQSLPATARAWLLMAYFHAALCGRNDVPLTALHQGFWDA